MDLLSLPLKHFKYEPPHSVFLRVLRLNLSIMLAQLAFYQSNTDQVLNLCLILNPPTKLKQSFGAGEMAQRV